MALYLVGSEDICNSKSGLFYLDPHYIQKAVPSASIVANEQKQILRQHLSEYHCSTLRSLAPSDMCTSLAPGFYLRDKEAFMAWKETILKIKQAYKDECIFSVFEKTPSFMMRGNSTPSEKSNEENDFAIIKPSNGSGLKNYKRKSSASFSDGFEDLGGFQNVCEEGSKVNKLQKDKSPILKSTKFDTEAD